MYLLESNHLLRTTGQLRVEHRCHEWFALSGLAFVRQCEPHLQDQAPQHGNVNDKDTHADKPKRPAQWLLQGLVCCTTRQFSLKKRARLRHEDCGVQLKNFIFTCWPAGIMNTRHTRPHRELARLELELARLELELARLELELAPLELEPARLELELEEAWAAAQVVQLGRRPVSPGCSSDLGGLY